MQFDVKSFIQVYASIVFHIRLMKAKDEVYKMHHCLRQAQGNVTKRFGEELTEIESRLEQQLVLSSSEEDSEG